MQLSNSKMRVFLAFVLVALLPMAFTPATARVHGSGGDFPTADEAVALAFEGCTIEKSTLFLTDEQRAEVERRLGAKLEGAVARPYVARDAAGVVRGAAWLDCHVVRTKKQTLMVAIDASARVLRIEVLAFDEPRTYLPRGSFFAQFVGRELDDRLALDRDVRNVAGATLSARATVDAARRALALHEVLLPAPQPVPEPEPEPEPQPGPSPAPTPTPPAPR
jgi:hypothetical protein